jgi:hypothetical protein
MRRVIPVSAVLLTAAATLSAQTGAWLGQPMTAWNQPAGAVPASGIGISSQAALERRCGSASAGTAVSSDALRRASWVTYRHLDQSLEKGDVEVIGGMTGATPGCEPTLFNLFVFVGGRFAGTVSPTRMMPSRDGAAGAVRIISDDTMTVEFARYTDGDPDCCPSSRVRVNYRIERKGAGPTLLATDTRQVR